MWLFTRYGFFSTVCARDGDGGASNPVDGDRIMVRARVRSHLEFLLRRFFRTLNGSGVEIQQFAGSDYPFRVFVSKSSWTKVMEMLAEEMDYDNFKSDVGNYVGQLGRRYEDALHDVWQVMRQLEARERKSPSPIDIDAWFAKQRTAVRRDWKRRKLPALRAPLTVDAQYTAADVQKIRKGVVPQQMEDKWFIYWRNATLYFHRSWTGFCVYVVNFEKRDDYYRIASAEANRDPRQYTETDDEHDARMICWLIDVLLLGRESAFPSKGAPPEMEAVELWHEVGRAMLDDSETTAEDKEEI